MGRAIAKPIITVNEGSDGFHYAFYPSYTLRATSYPIRLKQRALLKSRQMIGDKLATKNDLIELENNLRQDMRELECRIVIKLGGLMTVLIAVVATLVRLR